MPRTKVPEPGRVIRSPSTRNWSMVRWTVCLATPYWAAMAGIDGSRSPGAQSPRWIWARSWAAIWRCGDSGGPGLIVMRHILLPSFLGRSTHCAARSHARGTAAGEQAWTPSERPVRKVA